MVSWSINDPSLTLATDGPVRNMLGNPGAMAADLLLQTLGLAAAVALLPPMIWSLELMLGEHVTGLRNKATYYPFAVLGLAGAASALPLAASWPIEHGYGGAIGDMLFNAVASLARLVNSESAAAAAAVLLAGLGGSSLVHALGITADNAASFRRRPRPSMPHPSFAATAEPALRTTQHGLMSALATLKAWGHHAPGSRDAGIAPEPMLPGPLAYPAYPEPAYPAEPAYPERAPRARQEAPAYAPRPAAGRVRDRAEEPHDELASPDDEFADDEFADDEPIEPVDPALEMSSRAIAERFAPKGARPLSPAPLAGDDNDLPRIIRGAEPRGQAQAAPAQVQPVERTPRQKPAVARAFASRRADPVYKRPAPAMLKRSPPTKHGSEFSQTVLRGTARLLEDVLADFGVKGEVRDIKPGPVVTLFELEPARGTKATRIMALADDIARSMSATSARVAVIPGRNVVGIELPNARRDTVGLRELIESPSFAAADGVLPLALGRSIGGDPIIADLARMPHLLVAGTTGSGKSVGVNAMILSILFRHTPEQCRFLMIDPKMLELSVYNGIPHLLTPVVTDPQKAVGALNWVVAEMEERYKRMAQLSVRNIEAFNGRIKTARDRGEQLARTVQTGFDPGTGQPVYEREEMDLAPMAYIVVVVDEFADLMITAGKDIETAVQRLAQKARASGIHLIMATQRPSVDIITGTIKANFPTRISFKVASKIDSRTILNEQGAEQLLGQGDMLYTAGAGQMLRVHGPFVSDEEVEAVTAHLRTQGAPRYIESIADAQEETASAPRGRTEAADEGQDSLYDRAVAVVLRDRKPSTSYVQRRLSIGYNRAADLIERMEQEGLISAPNHTGRREILAGEPPARASA